MHGLRLVGALFVVGLLGLMPGFMGLDTVLAAGTTYYVAPGGTGDCATGQSRQTPLGTIQGALNCAAADSTTADSPDTIDIASGTYDEHLQITANVNLMGAGAGVVVDGTNNGRVVRVNGGYTVGMSRLTVTGGALHSSPGHRAQGAGILNNGTLTLTDSTVMDNTVSNSCSDGRFGCEAYGGGIYNYSGTVTLNNSIIKDNTASAPCTVGSFLCISYGGGIYTLGRVTLNNSIIADNTASAPCSGQSVVCTAYGGGIFVSYGPVTLTDSAIKDNTASASCTGGSSSCYALGGGIYIYRSTVTLNNSTVSKNTPDNCFPLGSIAGCEN